MMSLATRCGALSPYLQATKHKAKNIVLPGVKEFVPTAGKAKHRYEASGGVELCEIVFKISKHFNILLIGHQFLYR